MRFDTGAANGKSPEARPFAHAGPAIVTQTTDQARPNRLPDKAAGSGLAPAL
jgi:hypothetical protein